MLASRHVVFTALEGTLLNSGSQLSDSAADAIGELSRRHVPLVLASRGTRAQIEPLRTKIEHSHPFITESGGGLFLPDGYFSLRLEGAVRAARYFCIPFAQPYADATAALQEIAAAANASVVGYGQMSPREVARNTGEPLREAERACQREFSERFFFAGETEAATRRFEELARKRKWQVTPGDPFWELRSGNDEANAVRYLMRLYKKATPHTRLRSVGLGSSAEDLPLLSAVDHAVVLPQRGDKFDASLTSHLPNATFVDAPGPVGWGPAVLQILETP